MGLRITHPHPPNQRDGRHLEACGPAKCRLSGCTPDPRTQNQRFHQTRRWFGCRSQGSEAPSCTGPQFLREIQTVRLPRSVISDHPRAALDTKPGGRARNTSETRRRLSGDSLFFVFCFFFVSGRMGYKNSHVDSLRLPPLSKEPGKTNSCHWGRAALTTGDGSARGGWTRGSLCRGAGAGWATTSSKRTSAQNGASSLVSVSAGSIC